MGLSGREGSVTTKFCWAVWRALMKEKSGSSRTLSAAAGFSAIRDMEPPPCDMLSETSSSRCVLIAARSFSFSSLSRATLDCNDSSRNFFLILDLLACSLLRSLLSTFCCSDILRSCGLWRFFAAAPPDFVEERADVEVEVLDPPRVRPLVEVGGAALPVRPVTNPIWWAGPPCSWFETIASPSSWSRNTVSPEGVKKQSPKMSSMFREGVPAASPEPLAVEEAGMKRGVWTLSILLDVGKVLTGAGRAKKYADQG
mmetsp:Transcript_21541/g.44922  ORF Transcript_21541/g.44922 Transcript_21541/m.44922 type:complete len:256 (+) Transcript_21541:381-1148(+)